jgi:hypothetical protein
LAFIHHIELGAEPEVRTLMLTPGPAVLDSVAVPAGQDQVTLANGDILPGKLESVTATNVVMTGSFGRLDLPAARWSAINLAGTDNPPPTNPAAVRVFLPGGVQVSGRLGELAGDQLALASDLVGPVTLKRAVVRSLHFGLHLPPPTKYEYDPQSLTDALRPYAPGKMGLVSVARLSGELVSWTNDVVTWRHPAALAPLLVPQAGIAFINPAAVKNPPLPASTIELVNGDVLQAELLALDRQQLRVRTAHAGIWTVPAGYVREIHPGSSSSPSAADITRPDLQPALQRLSYRQYNWTNSLPDRVCVQWELVGPPVRWAMNATIFDPATGRNPDSRRAAWFLSLGNQVLSLFDNGAGPTYQTPSSVCLPGLARNGRARLTLLADRQAGEEFFLVNGQLVNERRNIKQPPTGNTISAIISIAQLHSVAIEEWRGSAADLSWPAKGDAVRLHDWTVLPGPIEELRNGQVLLSGGRSVPLTKVASLRFDPATRKTANAATVHVTLSPGERLSLSSPSFLAGKLDGTMPGIAPVSLPVTSVSRIQISATSPASWENLVQTKTFTERRQYCYKCHSQGSKP